MNLVEHAPTFILGIPLLFAFLIPLAGRVSKDIRDILFIMGLLLTGLFVAVMAYQVLTVEGWTYVFGGSRPRPVNPVTSYFRITFVADGFSVLATVTIALVAIGAGLFSFDYMAGHAALDKFYSLFLLTFAGVNGMVLTGDLFNLFVWFEVTSIASCGLIAFTNYRGKSVEAALKYMILSVLAGLFLLMAIGLLYGQYGVVNYKLLADGIAGSPPGLFVNKLALGILLIIFGMKASSVPMHMWAPDAYGESPGPATPLIAITSLGSLFVLFRLTFGVYGVNMGPEVIGTILIILGVLSMFIGVSMALVQSDLKRLIAYLSVSQVGYMMMAVGVALTTWTADGMNGYGIMAMEGGLFHMINDGVYKALLFLAAIAVIHATGKRNLNELGGLAHRMPYTTVFFLLGALSIAGVPPLSGFSSKLLIYQSVYLYHPLLAIIALVVSIVTLAVISKAFFNVFLGPDQKQTKGEVPGGMLFAMGMLTVVLIIFTLFPNYVVAEIVVPAIRGLGVIPL